MPSQGPSYISYLEAYQKQKIKLESKGLEMAEKPFANANEFRFAYAVERERMKKLVSEGKRSVKGNITQNLVSMQSYEQSLNQLRELKFAYEKKYNKPISIKALRDKSERAEIFFNDISNEYKLLKAQGKTNKQAREHISKTYFGS